MTINDVIYECELYPYSKACFDLMKECMEYDLLAQRIVNDEFVEENAEFVEEFSYVSGNDHYFQESISESDYDLLVEEAEEKKKSIFAKAKDWFLKVWEQIKRGFRWVKNKLFRNKKVAEEVNDEFEETSENEGITDEQLNKIEEVLDKGELGDTTGEGEVKPPTTVQPDANTVKIKTAAGSNASPQKVKNVQNKLAFVIGKGEYAYISVTKAQKLGCGKAIGSKDMMPLIDIRRKYFNNQGDPKLTELSKLLNHFRKINEDHNRYKKTGIDIIKDGQLLDEIISSLNDIMSDEEIVNMALDPEHKGFHDMMKKEAEGLNKGQKVVMKDIENLFSNFMPYLQNLIQSLSDTLKLYTLYVKYQTATLQELLAIVNKTN